MGQASIQFSPSVKFSPQTNNYYYNQANNTLINFNQPIHNEYDYIDYSVGFEPKVVAINEKLTSNEFSKWIENKKNDKNEFLAFTENDYESISSFADGIINSQTFIDKGTNTFLWLLSKNAVTIAITDTIEVLLHTSGANFSSLSTPIFEGLYKTVLGTLSGKVTDISSSIETFFKGFVKSDVSSYLKANVSRVAQPYLDAIKQINIRGISLDNLNGVIKDVVGTKYLTQFASVASKFGTTFGIDYAASLAVNVVIGIKDGELELEDLKLGSTFLTSSTKTIGGIVGECFGGKSGKLIGTAVGAFIGEIFVNLLKDENGNPDEAWCFAAGVAGIAGAGIGLAVFIVSNPVGWTVGACIAVGAAIGYVGVIVAYNFEKIVTIILNPDVFINELLYNVDEVINGVINKVSDIADGVKEDVLEFVDNTKEFIDDVECYIEEKVKADPVLNFFVGWAF